MNQSTLTKIYKDVTEMEARPVYTQLLLGAFGRMLPPDEEEAMREFFTDEDPDSLGAKAVASIQNRARKSMIVFQDPGILLVYFLAPKRVHEVKGTWPLLQSDLTVIYNDLGLSTAG